MNKVGVITRVQLRPTSRNDVLVDVNVGPNTEHENIPFRTPGNGVWFVPSVGEGVELSEYGRGRWIAHSPIGDNPGLPASAEEGDIVINKGSGTTIIVSDDGGVTIEAAGDINLDADNLFFDGSRLATENHTHTHSGEETSPASTDDGDLT